jgi:LPS sulfotransferase NodH
MPESYLICSTPRTGSSLLCGLLASTGVAGVPEAYFRWQNEEDWARQWGLSDFTYPEFVRAAMNVGRTGNGIFGAKVMWGTLEEMVEKLSPSYPELAGRDLDLLEREFGRTAFIFIERTDVIAQAVSRLRAEQTNLWYVGHPDPTGAEPQFDFDGIHHYVQEIAEHNAGWERWFAEFGVTPYRVRYEDLVADMPCVTGDILDFLGLDRAAAATITPRHERQADRINTEWIERYRQLRAQPRT